jgi:hypothetical protein
MRRLLAGALGAIALVSGTATLAGEVRIDGGDCASAVHLVARDAPLSDVLRRLASALDFQMDFSSTSDPLVNVDTERSPVDLATRLAPLENLSITLARNPHCPDRQRIVKIWVLPNASGAQSRQAKDDEEQARRAQAGMDIILSAHGMPSVPGAQTESR